MGIIEELINKINILEEENKTLSAKIKTIESMIGNMYSKEIATDKVFENTWRPSRLVKKFRKTFTASYLPEQWVILNQGIFLSELGIVVDIGKNIYVLNSKKISGAVNLWIDYNGENTIAVIGQEGKPYAHSATYEFYLWEF